MSQNVVGLSADAAPNPHSTALLQPPAEWHVGEAVPAEVFAMSLPTTCCPSWSCTNG